MRTEFTRPSLLLALLVGSLCGVSLRAQDETRWITSDEWTFLYPLVQGLDCDAGGEAHVSDAPWTAPFDLLRNQPETLETWNIDFDAAATSGWGAPSIDDQPVWLDEDLLRSLFPTADIPRNSPVIDFHRIRAAMDEVDPRARTLGLAVTYLENLIGEPLPLSVCLSSGGSLLVSLNNKIVDATSTCRPSMPACQESVEIVLPPGTSRLGVLCWEGNRDHEFRLGLSLEGTSLEPRNPFVRYLGGASESNQASEEFCLERSLVADTSMDCAPVGTDGCGGKWFVELHPQDPAGSPSRASPVVVVEEIRPRSGLSGDLTVGDVSNGGVVSDIMASSTVAERVCELPEFQVIGVDEGGGSFMEQDNAESYSATSTTGAEPFGDDEGVAFGSTSVDGDFDFAVEILESSHTTGIARNGRFGLMARERLDTCSRFSLLQDRLPDLTERAGFLRLTDDGDCNGVEETAVDEGGFSHPRFLRLTRRGSVVTGWVANHPGLAEGTLHPGIDAYWVKVFDDDWGEDAPSEMQVGFANSSGDSSEQIVRFSVLCPRSAATQVVGKRVRWEIPRDELVQLSYTVCSENSGGHSVTGRVEYDDSTTPVEGPPQIDFAAVPVGVWLGAQDIGPVQAAGDCRLVQGNYIQTAQGKGIGRNGDECHYTYRRVTGDFSLTARILNVTPPPHGSQRGQYGLMLRYGCAPDAGYHFPHASAFSAWSPSPTDIAYRGSRRVPDGLPWAIKELHFLDDTTLPGEGNPSWVRIVRRGKTVFHYVSEDNDNWILFGSSADPDMPDSVLAGMAVSSNSGLPMTVTYGSVTLQNIDDRERTVCLGADAPITEYDFASEDELSDAVVVDDPSGDGFEPGIVNERLRLTDRTARFTKSAVWLERLSGDPLADGLYFEFLVSVAEVREGQSAGVQFVVIDAPDSGLLNLNRFIGGGDAALGYEGGLPASLVQDGHQSVALEIDVFRDSVHENDPNGSNCDDCDTSYHFGLNFNGDVGSSVTVSADEFPGFDELFSAEGLQVAVAVGNDTGIDVMVAPADGSVPLQRILTAPMESFGDEIVYGFTAATGALPATFEIDKLSVQTPCCETDDEVSILASRSTIAVGEPTNLTALFSGDDVAGIGETFEWRVLSGPGQITTDPTISNIVVRGTDIGEVVVAVFAGDRACSEYASARTIVTVEPDCPTPRVECSGLRIVDAPAFGAGVFTFEATPSDPDASGLEYTFEASRGSTAFVVGPQSLSMARFELDAGVWQVTARVEQAGCPVGQAGLCELAVGVCAPALNYGESVGFVLFEGRPACFEIPRAREEDQALPVALTLTDDVADNFNVIYARWGTPPTRTEFDAVAAVAGSSSQQLLFPAGQDRSLYVLLDGRAFANRDAGNAVEFSAQLLRLGLKSIAPNRCGVGDEPTCRILGGGFTADTDFTLEDPVSGHDVIGRTVARISDSEVHVEFSTRGAPAGVYDLRASHDGGRALLPAAFTIGGGDRGFSALLYAAPELRSNATRFLRVAVRNDGPSTIRSPLMKLEACIHSVDVETSVACETIDDPGVQRVPVQLSVTGREKPDNNELLLLGWDRNNPFGTLPPSPTFSPVYVDVIGRALGDGAFRLLTYNTERSGADDSILWERLPPPDGVDAAEWAAAAPRMNSILGKTWNEFAAALPILGERLAARGRPSSSALEIFRFAFFEALGVPNSAIVGTLLNADGSPAPANLRIGAFAAGGELVACSRTRRGGEFVLEGLEPSESYRIAVSGFQLRNDRAQTPASGDLRGTTLRIVSLGSLFSEECHPPRLDDPSAGPRDVPMPPPSLFEEVATRGVLFVNSTDPNSKDGPSDEGDGGGLIPANVPLNYEIEFENEVVPDVPVETLKPAQVVTIRDPIDEDLNINSVTFGPIRIGDQQITSGIALPVPPTSCVECPPATTAMIETTVTMPDASTREVAITVSVDLALREISWVFETTGPGFIGDSDGFLPVNFTEVEPAGTGSVQYTVWASQPAAPETEIDNTAFIQFDNNPVIDTFPPVINVFPPEPSVPSNPQPEDQFGTAVSTPIVLSWESDNADEFDVYLWESGDTPPEIGVDLPLAANLQSPSLDVEVDVNESYRWLVVARNSVAFSPGIIGPEWRFRTEDSFVASFIRGDCNGDGSVLGSTTDPVFLLNFAFLGGRRPPCLASCDVDGDGQAAQVTDAVVLLNFNFLGGVTPPPPFPLCELTTRPSDRELGCEEPLVCE